MQKRNVLFINDSLWNSSGVFRALLPVLQNLDYEKYNVTLYITAGARIEPDARAQLPEAVRLIIGKDDSHAYRNVFVFALHLLSLFFGALRRKRAAAFFGGRTRSRIRKNSCKRQAKTFFGKETFHVAVANTVPVCGELAQYIRAEKKYVVFHSSKADFFPAQTKRCFETFTGVIAVSEGVKTVLAQAYPQGMGKIVTVTNYVDAAGLRQKAAAFSLPSQKGRVTLCTCGRLEKEKGFAMAVAAAKLLKENGRDFDWYFVGDGSLREALQKAAESCGVSDNVIFTGFQPNPYPYIAGCDIYVQPSFEEAQPLAVMEALILGKAIVSTETVGGKTILENGKKGVLTPITAEGLADGIETLLRDPEMRASFENLYTDEDDLKAKREYEEAWDRLLSE